MGEMRDEKKGKKEQYQARSLREEADKAFMAASAAFDQAEQVAQQTQQKANSV